MKRTFWTFSIVCCLAVLFFAGPGSSPPLVAQDIEVDSADPPSAEQGTINLNVAIKGKGFDHSAKAQFFLTGTENPGGITVNSTKFVSRTELIANIDVAEDAVIDNFDIMVMASRGRTGKGTELFSVTEKSTDPASDITPTIVTINDSFNGTPELTSDENTYNHPALGPIYVDTRLSGGDPCVRGFVNNTGLFRLHTTFGADPDSNCNDSIPAEQRRTFFVRFADPGVCELFGLASEWGQYGYCVLKTHSEPRIWAEKLFSPGNRRLLTALEVQFILADVSYVLRTDDKVPIEVWSDSKRSVFYVGTATLKTIGSGPQKPQTIKKGLPFACEITVERVRQ